MKAVTALDETTIQCVQRLRLAQLYGVELKHIFRVRYSIPVTVANFASACKHLYSKLSCVKNFMFIRCFKKKIKM